MPTSAKPMPPPPPVELYRGRPATGLPVARRRLLGIATTLALSVYYFNYGATFDEGEIQGGSPLTLPLRALAVMIVVLALAPLRVRAGSATLLGVLYLLSAAGLLIATAVHGVLNDTLFVNTLLQVPVLLALAGTCWPVDHARWMRLLFGILALQTLIDTGVWLGGASLWLSDAFVGGVGNPSSFGLLCSVGLAFALFHPHAGRWHGPVAAVLAFGALMSKALFAVLAVALLASVWTVLGWRRILASVILGSVALATAPTLSVGTSVADETGFIEHKLNAAGALLGVVEYDIESSASVSQRLEMHQATFAAVEDAPFSLLVGHLRGQPYWPMDSQLLTYLGSFGAPMLLAFLSIHLIWVVRAWQRRRGDGGFAFISLTLFGLIFATNRILDYFPIATLYFLIVASVLRPVTPFNPRSAANPARATRGSRRSFSAALRSAVP